MADSDDEYDRKRRDKFRGERSDYRSGGDASTARRAPPADDMRPRRDDWSDNRSGDWGRRPPRPIDYRLGGGPHRMPHEFSPPNKRPRVEWDRYSNDSGFSSGYGYQPAAGPFPHGPGPMMHRDSSDGQPNLLSFKSWLSTQDDSISDEEALTKYAEYKQEFKRQQLNEFFVAHREEEWFKNKYHPDDSAAKKEELYRNLKKRVDVFMEFMKAHRFDDVSLDSTHADKLVKLMDWYVIRLEGGTDEDARKLLETPIKPRTVSVSAEIKPDPDTAATTKNGDIEKKDEEGKGEEISGESDIGSDEEEEGAVPRKSKNKSSDGKPVADALENNNSIDTANDGDKKKSDEWADDDEEMGSGDETKKGQKRKLSTTSAHSSLPDQEEDKKVKEDDEDGKVVKKAVRQKILPPEPDDDELPQLHRTASIFLRNLSPAITKAEVEAVCIKYPGYMRVAIADPQPDRRWSRRGWVTFKRNVNIKEICWNFNSIRLRDTELGAIVNRDLTRRVRTVNGITPHKAVVRNDIRLAANVIQHLDSKWGLWGEDVHDGAKESYGVYSSNPVLKNITDYLIEEASAEEDELLGMSGGGGGSDGELEGGEGGDTDKQNTIERDEELIRVVDRLILYLRFVHSVDYYNHAEYPYEDDMPNRLGITHGRGMPPATKVTLAELQEYNRNFESKISTFATPIVLLTDEEVKQLGRKEEETEVEKFITSNTQELGKDKWLCPLSGKKFKGPEFVRKHILNKHAEKLEEVRKEVVFFNNYLKDPKRPHTPDPNSRPAAPSGGAMGGPGDRQPMMSRREPMMMPEAGGFHPPPYAPYGMGYGGGGGYGGGFGPRPPYQPYQNYGRGRPYRGGFDGRRPMISYRDLDAPNEPDDF